MHYREFLRRTAQSGLLKRADMLAVYEDFAEVRKRPTTDTERYTLLRNHLIAKGLLTEWQCEVLENRVDFPHFFIGNGKYKVLELASFDGTTCLFVAEDTHFHERVQISIITRDRNLLPYVVTKGEQIIERGTLGVAGGATEGRS